MSQALSAADRQLLRLWDFGWLDCHDIQIVVDPVPGTFVDRYLTSEAFGTSFVGPGLDALPDIHGPFRRDKVQAGHFRLLTTSELAYELVKVRNLPQFDEPPPTDQWERVEAKLLFLHQTNSWTFMLRLTEADKALFHDWGHVLYLFREFLFATPGSTTASRAIFGYD